MWIIALLGLCAANPIGSSISQRHVSRPTRVEREPAQCTFNAATNRFLCDNWLPTLDEMVARMQDANDGGRATRENRVLFFTKLVDPSIPKETEPYREEIGKVFAYIEAWARIHGYGENWYSSFNRPLSSQWLETQAEHVRQNHDNFAAKYGVERPVDLMSMCYSQALAFAAKVRTSQWRCLTTEMSRSTRSPFFSWLCQILSLGMKIQYGGWLRYVLYSCIMSPNWLTRVVLVGYPCLWQSSKCTNDLLGR
jgi:hypothetical protein